MELGNNHEDFGLVVNATEKSGNEDINLILEFKFMYMVRENKK